MMTTQPAEAGEALTITSMTERCGAQLRGEIDLATTPILDAALDGLVREDGDIHLDLVGLRFIDLSGAAALVATAARLDPDRALVLHDPPPTLTQILDSFWDGAVRIRVSRS